MRKGNTAALVLILLAVSPANAYIVVTIPDFKSIVESVCDCEVVSLNVSDPHSFALSSEDYELLGHAELIVLANSRLLTFEKKIRENYGNVLDIDDYGVELKDFPGFAANPHGYWMSPGNAVAIARGVKERLEEMHPEKSSKYEANFAAFAKLVDVASGEARRIAGIEGKKFVALVPGVCYIIDSMGGDVAAVLSSEAAGFVSGAELKEIAEKLKSGEYAAIVAPEFARGSKLGELAEQLARDTESRVVYVEFSSGDDYVEMLIHNAVSFVERSSASRGEEFLFYALAATCLAQAAVILYLGVRV